MAQPIPHSPALLLVAAFSRHEEAIAWGAGRMVEAFGPLALVSADFQFVETDYYEPTMGPGLKKRFYAFERPVDPADLAAIKLQTNAWEAAYGTLGRHAEIRPLNLDPGYLTAAKLVLASTKDHAHRIYLGRGIYAEVTLHYRHRRWEAGEFTFPDYRRADYHEFFGRARDYLRRRERQEPIA